MKIGKTVIFTHRKQKFQTTSLLENKIWDMLKKTYGGGPAIQFFLTNDENAIAEENLNKQSNFLYHNDYSMYGYPDKYPQYFNASLEITESSNGILKTITIPYRLLLSNHMPIKSLLYYVATKLKIDVCLLTVAINSGGQDVAELNVENGMISINETSYFYNNPHYIIKYSGSSGKFEVY